jgi:uroporphyrinogen decarboxylase
MDKRERVQAALEGRRVDRVPFTMWRHFYMQSQTTDGLVQATLDFYRRYDADVVILPAAPFYMAEPWGAEVRACGRDDVPCYLAGPAVARAPDWRRLPELDVAHSSLGREIGAVRQVRSELGQDDVPLVVPLYSPLTTADMLCNGRVVQDARSFSNDLRSGLQMIAAATRQFALACLEAGADGFILVTRLASAGLIRSREYRDFGQRFDLEVLDELGAGTIRILHMEGEQIFFDLVNRYPVQAVCWDTWRADPSLASASRQVRCALMGGLNPTTFAGGSVEDVRGQVRDAINQTGGWRLLVAPSGPLPPDSQDQVLASVSGVIQVLQR